MFISLTVAMIACVAHTALCHSHDPHVMTSKSHTEERHHIGEHVGGIMDPTALNQMAEDELRFLYFKMHDTDENNMLDGCELVKSLLHWHVAEHKAMSENHEAIHGTTRIFHHDELSMMVDPILGSDDKNFDGFIDYPEFVAAQKSRGF